MGTPNSRGSLRWLSLVAVTAAVVSADQVPAQAEDNVLSIILCLVAVWIGYMIGGWLNRL